MQHETCSLVEALGEAKDKLANIKKAEAAEVTVEELLGLAHRLSAAHSTSAPRDWQPGGCAQLISFASARIAIGYPQSHHWSRPSSPSATALAFLISGFPGRWTPDFFGFFSTHCKPLVSSCNNAPECTLPAGTSARRPFPSIHEMKSGSLSALAEGTGAFPP